MLPSGDTMVCSSACDYNCRMTRICLLPRVESGGMASFRLKFEAGLRSRRIEVTYDPAAPADALLIIAGTRNLLPLWKAARQGRRIVQRLDGINWVQRVRWAGVRYSLRAEYGNALLALIRARLAQRVIYQSQFIRRWWEDWYGPAPVPAWVILNGVDLAQYSPQGPEQRPTDHIRLLVVEGSLAGGLNTGLLAAFRLAEALSRRYPLELHIAGQVDERSRAALQRQTHLPVHFLGTLPRSQVPALMRSAHLLFSAEINPPCPNSVIEALACGLPVVGFDHGSLGELVAGDAGRLVPYGGNPWNLDLPDTASLAEAAVEVIEDQERFRRGARARAEAMFGLDRMVEAYLKVLLE